MSQFFRICSYFEITPEEFLDPNLHSPDIIKDTTKQLIFLNNDEIATVKSVIASLMKVKGVNKKE